MTGGATEAGNDPLAAPLRLPCGAVLPNRLCKAAMTEGLADPQQRATERHVRLYRAWSEGGVGLSITGNVMIDRQVIERPGNVAIDVTHPPSVDAEARQRLRNWAHAGTAAGNHLWMQISHAGRQSARYVTRQPLGPSAVQLNLLGNYARPRALARGRDPGLHRALRPGGGDRARVRLHRAFRCTAPTATSSAASCRR